MLATLVSWSLLWPSHSQDLPFRLILYKKLKKKKKNHNGKFFTTPVSHWGSLSPHNALQ